MNTVAIPLSFPVCDWNKDIQNCKSFAKIRFEKSDNYRTVRVQVYLDKSEGDFQSTDDTFIVSFRAQMNGPVTRDGSLMDETWYGLQVGADSAYVSSGLTVRNIGQASRCLTKAQKVIDACEYSPKRISSVIVDILRALKVNKVLVQACDSLPDRDVKAQWHDYYVLDCKSGYVFAQGFCDAFDKLCKD